MKRSEMVHIILLQLHGDSNYPGHKKDAENLMMVLERAGIAPPGVPAKLIRSKTHSWGGGCTMHCNCSDCDPKYIMHEREPEDT